MLSDERLLVEGAFHSENVLLGHVSVDHCSLNALEQFSADIS